MPSDQVTVKGGMPVYVADTWADCPAQIAVVPEITVAVGGPLQT
jgi:hypothetical protein